MNDNRISQYLQGRQAFAILTGEIDREAQKAAIRDGYKALHSLRADNMSIRDIMAATGLSKGKVEKDTRAAEYMTLFPKVDPVVVVKACNVGTAAQLRKATADAKTAAKGLAGIVSDANAEAREKRAARGSVSQVEKGEKVSKGEKDPRRTVTLATLADWIQSRQNLKASDIAYLDAIIAACEEQKVKARNNRAA